MKIVLIDKIKKYMFEDDVKEGETVENPVETVEIEGKVEEDSAINVDSTPTTDAEEVPQEETLIKEEVVEVDPQGTVEENKHSSEGTIEKSGSNC